MILRSEFLSGVTMMRRGLSGREREKHTVLSTFLRLGLSIFVKYTS